MSTYAIGDLHGCHAEFVSLLEKLRFNPAQDRLWLVGDLINRGPGSLACLMEAKALGGGVRCVLVGGHTCAGAEAALSVVLYLIIIFLRE